MVDVIRAWRDEKYYRSLTSEQQQSLPAHPAGLIELTDNDIRQVFGGSESSNTGCSKPVFACSESGGCGEPSAATTICVTYACC